MVRPDTLHDSSWAGGSDTDELDADDVAVAIVTRVPPPRSLLLLGAVPRCGAPMEWLTADTNCIPVQAPLLNQDMQAFDAIIIQHVCLRLRST